MPKNNMIIETEPGHFVVKGNAKTSIEINDYESAQFLNEQWLKRHSPVDSGTLQVTLAIFAISALFVNQQTDLPIRALSSIVFIFSLFATTLLTWAFMIPKIPLTRLNFRRSRFGKNKHFLMFFWLPVYYIRQLLRSVFTPYSVPFEEQTTELGYLTLLATIFLLEGVTIFIIMKAFS
jgi:hypothetical protein